MTVYNLVEEVTFHEKSRFGGVVNTLPCYTPGNPFGGVGSNPAGDVLLFAFLPEAALARPRQPYFSISNVCMYFTQSDSHERI